MKLLIALVLSMPPGTWFVERADGTRLERDADRPVNPASVAKLATTLWALEELGPEHRFETRFELWGHLDPESGVLHGDLVVRGGHDPDFHVENAQLVGWELQDLGLRRVSGSLRVDDGFLTGWEGGSERRLTDPRARARQMAERLRRAWDPARWKARQREDLEAFRSRRGIDRPFAAIAVGGVGLARDVDVEKQELTLTHLSNPLHVTLKRFNDYSNNDIERFGAVLGSVEELDERLGEDVTLSTLSGLGRNRITARRAVALLNQLAEKLSEHDLEPGDVLPQLGCGPSTLKNYRALEDGLPQASLVAKTGTLVQTDGGVIAMAGWVGGEPFFVATPGSGARQAAARDGQSAWLLGWASPGEGAICAAEQRSADFDVRVTSGKSRLDASR